MGRAEHGGIMEPRMGRVFLSRTAVHFLVQGSMKSFSVILERTAEKTYSPVALVGWSFMAVTGVAKLSAPLTSFLMVSFSNRFLGILGGVLAGSATIAIAYFATSLWILTVFNIIAGIGHGLLMLITTVEMAHTFGDSFGTAFSASTLLSSVGMITMPLLLDHWLNEYGFESAVILFGAFVLNVVPCGVLLYEDSRQTSDEDECIDESDPPLSRIEQQRKSRGAVCEDAVYRAHPAVFFATIARSLNLILFAYWTVYLIPLGTSKGHAPSTAVLLSSIGGTGVAIGRTLCIAVCYFDWMNNAVLFLGGMNCLVLGMVILILATEFYLLCVGSFVAGSMSALYISWLTAFQKCLVCDGHINAMMSWSFVADGVAVLSSGLLTDMAYDFRGSFEDVFILLAMIAATQVIISLPVILSNRLGVAP